MPKINIWFELNKFVIRFYEILGPLDVSEVGRWVILLKDVHENEKAKNRDSADSKTDDIWIISEYNYWGSIYTEEEHFISNYTFPLNIEPDR